MMIPLDRGLGAYSPPPANIQSVLQNASASSGVPYSILSALAYQESSYNPSAVSPTGAQGLLQIEPATGASLGLSNPFDPQQNANAGASYLMSLYNQYGDWQTALIAYNEGPGALASKGPYASSQTYASTILSNAGVTDTSGGSLDTSSGLMVPPDTTGNTTDTGISTTVLSGLSGLSTPEIVGIAAAGVLFLILVARR
jgi:hypothetical protein